MDAMKIGFLVHRTAYYKYFAPIIDEALKRGHQVLCLHDYAQSRTGRKGYNFPHIEDAPRFMFGCPEMVSYGDDNELIKIIQEADIRVIFSLHFLSRYSYPYTLLKERCKVFWVAIQHSVDGFLELSEKLNVPDRNFFYSDIWCDWATQYMSEIFRGDNTNEHIEKFRSSVRSVGFPELDQLGLIDHEKVRREWGIPDRKAVVLLLPFPAHYSFWSRFVYGTGNPVFQMIPILFSLRLRYIRDVWHGWNDPNIIKAIRRFCDRNDAYLLVKARRKDPVRAHLLSVADKVLYDESFYPATILKCLSISNVCIHFFSTAVTEAVPAGVSSIFISPPSEEFPDQHIPAIVREMLHDVIDFPGVSHYLSIPDAIRMLPQKSIKDFPMDSNRQKEYVGRFLRYSDGRSSCRILDEIEAMAR